MLAESQDRLTPILTTKCGDNMASPTNNKHPLLLLGPEMRAPSQSAHQLAKLHALMAEAMTARGIVGDTTFSATETAELTAYICDRQDIYTRYLKNEQLEPMHPGDASKRLGTKRHASAFASPSEPDPTEETDPPSKQTAASTLDAFVFAPVDKNVAANRSMPLQPHPLKMASAKKA